MCIYTSLVLEVSAVFFCRESHEAFAVDVDAKGVVAGYYYVNSKVKFVTEEKEGVVDVPADDTSLVFWHKGWLVHDENSFTLGTCLWFNDPHIVFRNFLDTFMGSIVPV